MRMGERTAEGRGAVDAFALVRTLLAIGRRADAITVLTAILGRDPASPEALFLLGAMRLQDGELEAAAPLLETAAATLPTRADVVAATGLLRLRLGRPQEAAALLDRAVALDPHDAETRLSLGAALQQCGRFGEARESYRAALAIAPDHPGVLSNLGALETSCGDATAGLALLDRAQSLDPVNAAILTNRALALNQLGRFDEAIAAAEASLALRPRHAPTHVHLADALHKAGRLIEAVAEAKAAIAIDPSSVDAWFTLANIHHDAQRPEEAVSCLAEVLSLAPMMADAHGNLGNALQTLGRLDEALAAYDDGLRLAPDNAQIAFNRAICLLQMGRLQDGFSAYEARWRTKRFQPILRRFSVPRWRGESLDPGTLLLLHGEQGLGDQLQFLRYAAWAAEKVRPGGVAVELDPRLVRLAATLSGLDPARDRVLGFGLQAPTGLAAEAPLMSLPAILGIAVDRIPAEVPYVLPPGGPWAFAPRSLRHVGLCWAGSPTHRQDRQRSLSLVHLAPLFAIEGIIWHSLQLGPAARALDAPDAPALIRHDGRLTDMADTAGLIAGLDLVVTCDTAIAHLAGALGRPTFVLIQEPADWRWLIGRSDSPWYPSLTLFRQRVRGDWAEPVARLAEALRAEVGRAEVGRAEVRRAEVRRADGT